MPSFSSMSRQQLEAEKSELEREYENYRKSNLRLNMSRGKPGSEQLDLSGFLLEGLDEYRSKDGIDCRNYGVLDGLEECKAIFSELTGAPAKYIIIGGNSSLSLMYDAFMRLFVFGTLGNKPWSEFEKVKFLCPSPGYDRHFLICEELGVEMITVPLRDDGPDMDIVERLVASDEAIKGIWCVPLYSNPTGAVYSDETVDRLAAMKTAAPDFRIFWDNAYAIHHIYEPQRIKNIFKACEAASNPERAYMFFSTSKVTFPGAGVSMIAAGPQSTAEIKRRMSIQTIGHDKLNQLRFVKKFQSAENVCIHMRQHAKLLRPKFETVLQILEKDLKGTGCARWSCPKGGYFISVDTMEGCAKETVRLAGEAGVTLTPAGSTYPYKKDPEDKNIRIAPTFPPIEELQIAMELFCVCVKLAAVNKLLGLK
jgi:aspartate/methionine/tyrosine aminotransferase